MGIAEKKQKLRNELKQVLSYIPEAEKQKKSEIIFNKVLADPSFIKAKSVMIFSSMKNEPDISDFARNPVKYRKDFTLPESPDLNAIKYFDLILVPGLGFDNKFNRLGRGGGWYDKFLKSVKAGRIIGLCFKEQVVDALPTAEFDIKVDQLITD